MTEIEDKIKEIRYKLYIRYGLKPITKFCATIEIDKVILETLDFAKSTKGVKE